MIPYDLILCLMLGFVAWGLIQVARWLRAIAYEIRGHTNALWWTRAITSADEEKQP